RLGPKIVTPDLLDERRVVQTFHPDPARLGDLRALLPQRDRARGGPARLRRRRARAHQRGHLALDEKRRRLQRKEPHLAVPVFELNRARLEPHDSAAESALRALHDQADFRWHDRNVTTHSITL